MVFQPHFFVEGVSARGELLAKQRFFLAVRFRPLAVTSITGIGTCGEMEHALGIWMEILLFEEGAKRAIVDLSHQEGVDNSNLSQCKMLLCEPFEQEVGLVFDMPVVETASLDNLDHWPGEG